MIDLDYGPGVFMFWIALATSVPIIYGVFFVDAYWEKHQAEERDSEDVFN